MTTTTSQTVVIADIHRLAGGGRHIRPPPARLVVCREDHHQPDGGSLCDGGERPRVRLDVRPPTSSTCLQPVGPFDGTAERLIYET